MLRKILTSPSLGIYFTSTSIRAVTIGAKFGLTFFLGKEYSEEFLGEYGLFSTSIILCYFVLSLSFDSYALREVVQKTADQQFTYIRNIFVFYFIAFFAFAPLTILIFHLDLLRSDLLIYFLVLLFLETINQSFFALFTILQRPTIANLILFFSQGLWILFVFFTWYFTSIDLQSFESFLVAWIVSSAIASLYAFTTLKKIYRNSTVNSLIDWMWIRAGLSVSLIFFVTALSYKLIEFFDRYFIEFQLGPAKLGIYVFFSQMANLINTAINVMVIIILYPKLIESHFKQDTGAFIMFRNKMYLRVLFLGLCIGILEIMFINPLLQFLNKKSFENEVNILYILIFGNIAMNLSFIPHYCLYAFRKDSILLVTTVFGAFLSALLNLILIPIFGLSGAALATFISFSVVFLLKAFYLRKNLQTLSK